MLDQYFSIFLNENCWSSPPAPVAGEGGDTTASWMADKPQCVRGGR
jgi:hypothetical protein